MLASTLLAMVLDVLLPLGGAVARWIALGALGVGLAWMVRWGFLVLRGNRRAIPAKVWLLGGLGVLVILVFSGWALGEPTNYDTGLYHIGAIGYARDFAAVPGLANLHERFGFNSSMWPLSAWLGAAWWPGNEIRIVNGVLLAVLLAELSLRIVGLNGSRRSRISPGTAIVMIGTVLVLGVLAQYPGRLLASSAQDTAALILGLVAIAYFSDAMRGSNWWHMSRDSNAAVTAVVLAVSGALMRPLGWVLVAGMVLTAFIVAARARQVNAARRPLIVMVTVGAVAGSVTAVRDWFLSGWLLYPAGVLGFPVDWRFPDPSVSSDRITAWARTPFQDVDTTLASFQWVGGWLARLPTDWSIPALAGLLALSGLLWRFSAKMEGVRPLSGMLRSLAPVAALLIAWLVTAPDPRFAWAPIIGLGLIPVGFLARQVAVNQLLLGSGLVLVSLLVLASLRGSWAAWSVTPVEPRTATVEESSLGDGTQVLVPVGGDQCWRTYPLCRPDYESVGVQQRGSGLNAGFKPLSSDRDHGS